MALLCHVITSFFTAPIHGGRYEPRNPNRLTSLSRRSLTLSKAKASLARQTSAALSCVFG